jgi:hypothetical protein
MNRATTRPEGVGVIMALCLAVGALHGIARGQADSCANATPIVEGVYTGTTAGATTDGAVPTACAAPSSGADVWYSFTPYWNCMISADTCTAAGFDTVLSIHSGCPGAGGTVLACNDDWCADTRSRVEWNATAGVTYLIRVAGLAGATGAFTLRVQCGADAVVAGISDMDQYGRVGGTIGASLESPLCNLGNTPLDTVMNPDPRHPFFMFNAYRLRDGRLQQIGQSWAKHMRGAAQETACSTACVPYPTFNALGVNCSDTYTTATSATQAFLSPRSEINPYTGAFTYAGSFISQNIPPASEIDRRMQLRDADIDPAANPGAAWFAEFRVVAHDDADKMNSVGRRPFVAAGSPGGTWAFSFTGPPALGPVIDAWPGATRTTIRADVLVDGRCILAAKVTPNADGTWHYEYALYNHDLDRGVGSLSIPVGTAAVTNVGFYAVASHGEAYDNVPWGSARSGRNLAWSTVPFSQDPTPNPLRWGTMYNFWFDADRAPTASAAVLGLFKPGSPATLSGPVQAPAGACVADWDGDGEVAPADLAAFVNNWFQSLAGGTLGGDFDGNGLVEPADVAAMVAAWLQAVTSGC